MNNAMADIETYGTSANAAIVSIGAVAFDLANRAIGETFYQVIDLDSAIEAGGVVDPSTVVWWSKQSQEAQDALKVDAKPIKEVLEAFSEYCGKLAGRKSLKMWGNGSDFDNVIIASAYQRLGILPPWEYFNNRCYRTIKSLYPQIKLVRKGTHHNALADAESQAAHLIELLNPTYFPNQIKL